ncbi:MAG: hypothetical protein UY82_C0064G0004 [Candidatus Uhrbacteria bacterium GW2011_GWC2_53_7]|uniref:Uncharacterized protein n=1 Tax=Candidatus Uhrbacteria bacterium GW2011_GWC2_53_7 TaxID=1618986 RepID=A0A0G1XU03_9BACT|nr:MAG: hypothetical protein UY82_C0064G0004 [Candidatus Uhrbacteria bacterium GW2011_GWC2_53_7]
MKKFGSLGLLLVIIALVCLLGAVVVVVGAMGGTWGGKPQNPRGRDFEVPVVNKQRDSIPRLRLRSSGHTGSKAGDGGHLHL